MQDHPGRRAALWQISTVGRDGPLLEGAEDEEGACPLPEMTEAEQLEADYRGTSLTVAPHPLAMHREVLAAQDVRRSSDLGSCRHGARVQVAGVVIVRQRPQTAKGYVFLTLEDEAGLSNIIVTPDLFEAQRALLTSAPALVVEGVLQKEGGSTSIKSGRCAALEAMVLRGASHDFH